VNGDGVVGLRGVASDMASYMGPVNAFFFSARRKRISCTPPSTVIWISWVIAFLLLRVPSPRLRGEG
jgi:hypothetical protein